MSFAFSRRAFLTGASALGATTLVAGCATNSAGTTSGDAAIKFGGEHQAGITTAQQDRMHFAAFNVVTKERSELEELLKKWTAMARRMTRGETTVDETIEDVGQHSVPKDTGEAYDLEPANLTITIRFGPSPFNDRFGLGSARPKELKDLPKFSGDIAIQACSDNPQVAIHAIRNLARAGSGVVEYKWSQLGFGHATATTRGQQTPRNLFGFKDGTNNIKAEDQDIVNEHVWVSGTDSWFDGGTFAASACSWKTGTARYLPTKRRPLDAPRAAALPWAAATNSTSCHWTNTTALLAR
ncbi:Dyp-type peroxidase [Corynebacterium striatum]|uniref:Dyp-type peroxidase n=1 Tax=Corynebacterium striatum TaxID=43770 RepID=UPI0023F72E9B|nr:Dyp-type peroxidase [Corynebacterium striatum]